MIERFFFPSQKTFKKGIVYKYYYSNYSKKTKSTTTDVQYNYLKMINDSVFSEVLYNSAFHIIKNNLYEQKGVVVEEINEIVCLKNGDSIIAIYQGNNDYLTFETDTVYSSSKISKDDFSRIQEQFSNLVKDSIVNSEPAKIVNRTINSIIYNKGIPQDTSRIDIREIYIKDFGLWRLNSEDEERKRELILVEQIKSIVCMFNY